MGTHAQVKKPSQQTKSVGSTIHSRVYSGQSHEIRAILNSQHTIDNHEEQQLLRADTEERENDSPVNVTPCFAQDFNPKPVYAKTNTNIQPKLKVNAPEDLYEQEADRVADRMMRMQVTQLQHGSVCGDKECHKCPTGQSAQIRSLIQRKGGQANKTGKLDAQDDALRVLRASGQPLDQSTRAFFEPRLGRDLSEVRVHTGAGAENSTQGINAEAYTFGTDIVFGAGRYSPKSGTGRRLIAHELTHVLQQSDPAPESAGTRFSGHDSSNQSGSPNKIQAFGKMIMRQQASAAVPQFPATGINVIGPNASDLASILTDCTGILLNIDSNDMLEAFQGPVQSTQVSMTARNTLSGMLNSTAGIIVDTSPSALGAQIGVFSHTYPGFQQIDVANIQTMAAASGVGGGITACDAIMHEMTEAHSARQAFLQNAANVGQTAFQPAHTAGTLVEDQIRQDLGLEVRSTAQQGNTVMIGTLSNGHLLILSSMIFGQGTNTRTQISVVECTLHVTGPSTSTCDLDVRASTVVSGLVQFTTQQQAIQVFNQHATAFGYQPLAVPP